MRTVSRKLRAGTAHAGTGGHTMGNDVDLRPTDAAERDRDKSNDDTHRDRWIAQAIGPQEQVALSGSTRNQESQSWSWHMGESGTRLHKDNLD